MRLKFWTSIAFLVILAPLPAQDNSDKTVILTHGWRASADDWLGTAVYNFMQYEYKPGRLLRAELDGKKSSNEQAGNLRSFLNTEHVNFGISVAHSMGGVNTRNYMHQEFTSGRDSKVTQLYTFGTPHYGSKVADNFDKAKRLLLTRAEAIISPNPLADLGADKLGNIVIRAVFSAAAELAVALTSEYMDERFLSDEAIGNAGLQDLRTDANVYSRINEQIQSGEIRRYEKIYKKIGIIGYDRNPILLRMAAHAVNQSEDSIINAWESVKKLRKYLLGYYKFKYYLMPLSPFRRAKYLRAKASYAAVKELDNDWRKNILEEPNDEQSDGVSTRATQRYPGANQFYFAEDVAHTEQQNANNIVRELRQALLDHADTGIAPTEAPGKPTVFAETPTIIAIDWTANTDNGFQRIERALDANGSPGAWEFVAYVDYDVNQYDDEMVQPNTTYWYCIRAWNAWGVSPWSAPDKGTTPANPSNLPKPVILPIASTFDKSVEVSISISNQENIYLPQIIRYTLDGSTPTENSQQYSYPFTLISSATVKARTFQEGETPSTTDTKAYTITNGSSGSHKARVEIDPVDQWDSFTCRVVNESASAKISKVILTGKDNSTFDVFSGGQYFWVEPSLGANNNGVTSNSATLWFTSHALAPGESDANGTGNDLDWNNKSLQAEIHFDDNKIFAAQMANVGDSDDGNNELWQANFGTSGGTTPPPPPASGDYNATVTLEITNTQWDMFICRVENGSNSTPISSIDLAIQDIDGNFDVFGNGSLYTVSPNLGSNNNGTYSPNVTLNFSSALAAGQNDVNNSGDMDGPVTDIQVTIHYSDGTNNTLSMSKTGNDWVAQDGNGGGTNLPPSNDYNATLTLENTNVQWNNFICRVENGSNSKAIESIDLAIQDIDGNFDVFGNGSLYTVSPNLGSNNNGTYSSNVTLNFTLPLTAGQSDVNSSGDMDGPITDIRATFHYADGADRTITMTKSGEDWIAQDGNGGASKRNLLGLKQMTSTLPRDIRLHPAYPNPFTNKTAIEFNLQNPATVKLAVYDIRGREIKRLVDTWVAAGRHRATWNGQDKNGNALSSGLYFLRLQSGPFHAVQKVVLKH